MRGDTFAPIQHLLCTSHLTILTRAPMMTEQALTLEEAKKRVDEIAEVTQIAISRSHLPILIVPSFQVLACRASISKGDDVIELRRLCGKHRIVPKSYILEGTEREGRLPQCLSQVTEVWKGVWNDKVVALKVLRPPRDDHDFQRTKSVSTISGGSLATTLTGGVAVLQGSGIDETTL